MWQQPAVGSVSLAGLVLVLPQGCGEHFLLDVLPHCTAGAGLAQELKEFKQKISWRKLAVVRKMR